MDYGKWIAFIVIIANLMLAILNWRLTY